MARPAHSTAASLLGLLDWLAAAASLGPSVAAYVARGALPSEQTGLWYARRLEANLLDVLRGGLTAPNQRHRLHLITEEANHVAAFLREWALGDPDILAGPDRWDALGAGPASHNLAQSDDDLIPA